MAHIVVGTAGHIDHGKSSLVRALTGTDPDRLPEEKRRQITIDLGYAFLDDVAALIDVPGHEKFIHNMVAGASTVDFALLVVAADDGVMPQTTEHLHILNLLGILHGAIVLTKITLADTTWRELVKEQIRDAVSNTFLRDAPIFPVDSLSLEGIPELRDYLTNTLDRMPRRAGHGQFRLAVDRVFSMHGHGTVVTGTILSGKVSATSKVMIYPEAWTARVKQLQTHGRIAEALQPGSRAALNLHSEGELRRGQTVAELDSLVPTSRLIASFNDIPSAPPLKDRQRIRLLITTQEVIGRARIIGKSEATTYVALELEEPAVAAWGDHYVLRRYSPLCTLGGGRVLDPLPPRVTARNRDTLLASNATVDTNDISNAMREWIRSHSEHGVEVSLTARAFGLPLCVVEELQANSPESFIRCEGVISAASHQERWKARLKQHVAALHRKNPESDGFSLGQLQQALPNLNPALLERTISALVNDGFLRRKGSLFAQSNLTGAVPEQIRKLSDDIAKRLKQAGFAPPSAGALAEELRLPRRDIERALVHLDKQGLTFRMGSDIFFDKSVFEGALLRTKAMLNEGPLQVAELSKALESSRKYVVPFLEYLDSLGITERRENSRVRGRNFST